MKTSLILGAALAILGVAAAPLISQTQTTTSSTSTGYVQTSKVIGTKVKTSQGEEVGVVKDVVLDRSTGCMAYTVLSTGGVGTRITGGGKLVAVPWSIYSTSASPDAGFLTVSVERDRIYNAPVFEYSRISDTTYTSNIYSHFGVAAGVGVSSTTSMGATTTTGATTTGTNTNAGATLQSEGGVSPSPSVSPGASASAAPSASVSPSASGSPNPNLTPPANSRSSAPSDAKATASPKSGTKVHSQSGESATSSRHKGEEANEGGNNESTSEATGSSSGKKSSTRKGSSEESSEEGATSPSSKKSSHKKGSSEGTSEAVPTPGGEQE